MKHKIFSALISVITLFCILFSCACGFSDNGNDITETTGEYITDRNGNQVPVYESVDASVLDPDKFITDENGRKAYSDPSVSTYTGIDVSTFQGEIDWEKVAADGIDFVMLRAGYRGYGSEGKLGEDSRFSENCKGALAAGIDVGVYFFSQATSVSEAREEADFVLDIINDYNITYPVAFDWEKITYDSARTDNMTSEEITAAANAFCNRITQEGYSTVIYFNRDTGYFNYDLSLINDYHFWLAEFYETPSFYYDYKIWQYTESGTVDGIEGNVDINISIVDYSKK